MINIDNQKENLNKKLVVESEAKAEPKMFDSASIEERWKVSSATEKVQQIDNIIHECQRIQKKESELTSEQILNPSELFCFFKRANLQYSEWIKHSNPCINNGALQLLSTDIVIRQSDLTFSIPDVVSSILLYSLARKELKVLAVPILLRFAECHREEFVQGIISALNSKGQKGLLDALRFIQLITQSDKIEVIQPIMETIFSLTINSAQNNIRQEALNVIKQAGSEIGIPFIEKDLHKLKDSQRIYLAKTLKVPSLAEKEIGVIEKRKAEVHRLMTENQAGKPSAEAAAYQEYRQSIVKMVVDISQKRKEFNESIAQFDIRSQKEMIQAQRIQYLKSLPHITDKLREAKSKEQVFIVQEVHELFKLKKIKETEYKDLPWNFQKYLQFNNPFCAVLIMEIIQMYIENHPDKSELNRSFDDQVFEVFLRIIKNLSINSVSMMEPTVNLTKFLIKYGVFNERIMNAWLTAMEHKSTKVQRQALQLFSSTVVSKDMMKIPGIKLVLSRVVVLASVTPVKMDSSKVHLSEELVRVALQVLVDVAEKIHEAVFEFSDKLSKFSNLQFQEQTKKLFFDLHESVHLDKNINSEFEDEERKHEYKESLIIPEEVVKKQAQWKSKLSQRFIEKEKEFFLEMSVIFNSSPSDGVIRKQYLKFLLEFLNSDQKYLALNTMRVISKIIDIWNEEENKILFEKVFTNVISEIKAHTIALVINLFNYRINKKDAYEFVTRNINMKIFEERAFEFLTKQMEVIFVEDQDIQKLRSLAVQAIDSIRDPSNTTKKQTLVDFLANIQYFKGAEIIEEVAKSQISDENIRQATLKSVSSSLQKLEFFEKARQARLKYLEQDEFFENKEKEQKQQQQQSEKQSQQIENNKNIKKYDEDDDDDEV